MPRGLVLALRYQVWLAIWLSAFGWGSGDVVTRLLLEEDVGPYTLTFLRTAIAAGCLILYRQVRRQRRIRGRSNYRLILVQSMFAWAIPVVLITIALQYASAGFVGVVFALAPISTASFAHFMVRNEKFSTSLFFGLMVAVGGVAILLFSGDAGLAEKGQPIVAFILTFIAACLVAYATVYARRVSEEYEPLTLAERQFFIAAIVLYGVMVGMEGHPRSIDISEWINIIYLGLVGTLMPIVAVLWALKKASATLTSLGAYLAPFIAFVGGVWLLDERLQRGLVVGGALILAGVVLADRVDRGRTALSE